jgi:hypothetical protein
MTTAAATKLLLAVHEDADVQRAGKGDPYVL